MLELLRQAALVIKQTVSTYLFNLLIFFICILQLVKKFVSLAHSKCAAHFIEIMLKLSNSRSLVLFSSVSA